MHGTREPETMACRSPMVLPTDQAYMVLVELFKTMALPTADTDVAYARRHEMTKCIVRCIYRANVDKEDSGMNE